MPKGTDDQALRDAIEVDVEVVCVSRCRDVVSACAFMVSADLAAYVTLDRGDEAVYRR